MIYLKSFTLPSRIEEDEYVLSYPPELELGCCDVNNAYPFRIFADRVSEPFVFSEITCFSGGNGSGKSTLLNVIAEAVGARRLSSIGAPKCMNAYVERCSYRLAYGYDFIPNDSLVIRSDDVFDFLLDLRSINDGAAKDRAEVYSKYKELRLSEYKPLASLNEIEEFRTNNEAKRSTASAFMSKRVPKDIPSKSNGESAFYFFTDKIKENSLYILDEPENSLSPILQTALVDYLRDSARFYNCQFIISTHSPFILAMKEARIYDLDKDPIREESFEKLPSVDIYRRLFSR